MNSNNNSNKLHWSSEYLHDCPAPTTTQQHHHQSQQYMSKVELEQQAGLMYPGKA